MTTLGLYLPGDSPLHRAAAGPKLVALLAAGVSTIWLHHLWQVGLLLLVVLIGHAIAEVPALHVVRLLRQLVWLLGAIGTAQWLVSGPTHALTVVGLLVALALAAHLVTLTTRTSDLVDVTVSLAERLPWPKVDGERVGLYLALAIRSVPVTLTLAADVRDAQRARGLESSLRAFAVPLVVRVLMHADSLGEALVARGAAD